MFTWFRLALRPAADFCSLYVTPCLIHDTPDTEPARIAYTGVACPMASSGLHNPISSHANSRFSVWGYLYTNLTTHYCNYTLVLTREHLHDMHDLSSQLVEHAEARNGPSGFLSSSHVKRRSHYRCLCRPGCTCLPPPSSRGKCAGSSGGSGGLVPGVVRMSLRRLLEEGAVGMWSVYLSSPRLKRRYPSQVSTNDNGHLSLRCWMDVLNHQGCHRSC